MTKRNALKGSIVTISGYFNMIMHQKKYLKDTITPERIYRKISTPGDIVLDAKKNGSFKAMAGLKLESPATTDVKGSMTTVEGSGICTIKGGLVKIN